MSECKKNVMCNLNLNTKDDTKKWLLKNHPDKGGNVNTELFKNVTNCYKNRDYCDESIVNNKIKTKSSIKTTRKQLEYNKQGVMRKNTIKVDKKKRDKIYKCMRQTANWGKILPEHKIDNKKFNPKKVEETIHNASPKLEQLFNIIKQVDDNDMKTHGKLFKHFIFSDVKEEGYGAKIVASAFVANGYKNLITAQKVGTQKSLKLKLLNAGKDGKNKSFGMLSSSALFNSEFNQKFKKEVLTMYNKRPDNIQGEEMRFIILDSGFKEGIDLFDVKYVHIFEPSMTVADLKQTIGRATRTCGQKGLNFEPNVGWPLFVYNYYIAVPEEIKSIYEASNTDLLVNPQEDKMLFKNAKKLKDAIILYSEFDKTLSNLSEQLYKLAPVFSVDFELTEKIHRIDDLSYLYEQQQTVGGGLGDKSEIKCKGKCGLRSTNDIPATVDFLYKVYVKYGHPRNRVPAKQSRAYFCDYMKSYPAYCEQVNKEWVNRAAFVPYLYEKTAKQSKTAKRNKKKTLKRNERGTYIDIKANNSTPYMEVGEQKSPSYMELDNGSATSYMEIGSSKRSSTSPLKIANDVMQTLELVPYVPPTAEIDYAIVEYDGKPDEKLKQSIPGPPSKKMSFQKMRDFIKTNYMKKFTWGDIVIENKCVDKPQQGGSRIMTLNPTQDFVRTFFTPESPYKGILLFHSVGTGKTCSAIATATSSFEPEGYTILWVTRNTLKSDVYKNMFDDVCHIVLAEKMKKQGLKIPDDPSKRKRLLSKNWIEPISYKTFSNLLTPGAHNEYMDKLIQRNGKSDILRKTLIIIDEAHKLYGGDLKASERPNMKIMEQLLQKSYKVSGKNSARLLIMTATPFTNSPMELFQLINLCKEEQREKIPTDIHDFKMNYMSSDNILTNNGIKKLADQLTGYISYLNREQDPTQFAQPIMIEVPAIMSHIDDPELRKQLFLQSDKENKKAKKERNKQAATDKKEDTLHIKELNKRLRETQKNIKSLIKEKQNKCKTIKKRDEKTKCMKQIKEGVERETAQTLQSIKGDIELLKELEKNNKGLKVQEKQRVKELKKQIDRLRDRLLQEVMMVERCKNIRLV